MTDAYAAALAKASKAAIRRSKREQKAATLWPKKVKKKKSPSLSKLKKMLWTEISLLVRSWSPVCVACKVNPTYSANHIVPSNDGAATRFFLPNLYPGCASCNEAERRRRGQWVKRHEEIFGVDFVDALYSMSQTVFQPKKWWVLEQIERIKKLRGING